MLNGIRLFHGPLEIFFGHEAILAGTFDDVANETVFNNVRASTPARCIFGKVLVKPLGGGIRDGREQPDAALIVEFEIVFRAEVGTFDAVPVIGSGIAVWELQRFGFDGTEGRAGCDVAEYSVKFVQDVSLAVVDGESVYV